MTLMFQNRDVATNAPSTRPQVRPMMAGGASPQASPQAGASGDYGVMTNAQGIPWGELAGSRPTTASGYNPMSGASTSSFGPGNDLRSTAIMPGQSQQTRTASGMADGAASAYSNYNLAPFQGMQPMTSTGIGQYGAIQPTAQRQAGTTDPTAARGYADKAVGALGGATRTAGLSALGDLAATGGEGGGGYSYGGPGADVTKARASAMSALDAAMTGTDRGKIASDTFDLTAARGDDAFNRAVRQTGQKAAALGRAGSGMVNTDLADVTTARATELDRLRKDLSLDAAEKSLQDRMNLTNLGTSTANAFADSDRSDGGLNLAGAQLGEQSAARRAGNRLSAAGQMVGAGEFDAQVYRGLGNDRFGQDSTITGERGRDVDRATDTDRFNTGLRERQSEFQYGADRDIYDRNVNERNTSRRDEYDQGDFLGSKFNTMAGWLTNREGQDRENRGEMRGERDYQGAMARQAMEDGRTRMFDEEAIRNGRYNRASGTASLANGQPSPAGAYQGAADRAQGSAGDYFSTLGPMAQYLASRNGGQRTAANSPNVYQGLQ